MSDRLSPQPDQKTPRPGWLRQLGSLAALVLLVYLLSQQGWGEIAAAMRKLSAWQLGLAFLFTLCSRLAVTARWYVLLQGVNLPISFAQTLRITFAGLFASNFLPTTIGGDVIRLAGAAQVKDSQGQRCDPAVCAASLIVDRLVGMAGMVMALPFSLPGLPVLLQKLTWRSAGYATLPFFSSSAAFLTNASHQDKRHPQISTISQWQITLRQKILQVWQRLLNALNMWRHKPRTLLLSLAYSWIHMLCLYGILSLLLSGMGAPLSFWLIAGLYSLVYFVTLIPISINGYGLQEISMTLIFSGMGQASVSNSLSIALLFRTLTILASLPGALFVSGMLSNDQKG